MNVVARGMVKRTRDMASCDLMGAERRALIMPQEK
jgi:hypothetical protein